MDVKRRIDNIIDSGFAILVGDANGADKAVQRYLADRQYQNVTVFCVTGDCRNNVGHWRTRDISAPADARGFAFYTVKDRAMADDATHGLMLVAPFFQNGVLYVFVEKDAETEWRKYLAELSGFGFLKTYSFEDTLVPVSVIGDRFSQDGKAALRVLEVLAGQQISVTIGSSSALAMTVAVPENRADEAVQALHQEFLP